jgi:hypothetical protein
MTNLEAKEFLVCSRYALMLAEQVQEQAIRDNLLTLVRAWLAAAKDVENPATNTRLNSSKITALP